MEELFLTYVELIFLNKPYEDLGVKRLYSRLLMTPIGILLMFITLRSMGILRL